MRKIAGEDVMRKTGVYRNNLFLEHQPGITHPESPERLRVIYEALDKGDMAEHFIFPDFAGGESNFRSDFVKNNAVP